MALAAGLNVMAAATRMLARITSGGGWGVVFQQPARAGNISQGSRTTLENGFLTAEFIRTRASGRREVIL
jgi:hypothetical protein